LLIFVAVGNLLTIDLTGKGRFWISSLFFALAAMTRPEGILLFGTFYCLYFIIKLFRRANIKPLILSSLIFIVIIGAQFIFRYFYYGYPFPNTFYAKVTGTWIDMGLLYQFTFIHEYGLYLLLPVAAFIFTRHYDGQKKALFLKTAAAFAPYFVYLIIIGGDHFEYRPLDVAVPFLALILQEGFRAGYHYVHSAKPRLAGDILAAALVIFLLFHTVPGLISHINFRTVYDAALGVKTAERNFLARIPVIKQYLQLFDRTHDKLAKSFICIRAEEHKMALRQIFYEQAMSLKKSVDRGIINKDEVISLDCVGAIPYYSGLTTIDKLGLTDAYVAHMKVGKKEGRLMAHEKRTDMGYLWDRRVTYVAIHPSLFFFPRDLIYKDGEFETEMLKRRSYIIPVDDEYFVFYSVYPPDILGPKLLERGLEFYYVDKELNVFLFKP
jgi:hypothetical protein